MKNKILFALKVVFLLLIVLWIGIVVVDYFNARNAKDPVVCMKQEVHVYDKSGSTDYDVYKKEDFLDKFSEKERENMSYTKVCVGLGYKVYEYHRIFNDSKRNFNAVEFGPFFITERQSAN